MTNHIFTINRSDAGIANTVNEQAEVKKEISFNVSVVNRETQTRTSAIIELNKGTDDGANYTNEVDKSSDDAESNINAVSIDTKTTRYRSHRMKSYIEELTNVTEVLGNW